MGVGTDPIIDPRSAPSAAATRPWVAGAALGAAAACGCAAIALVNPTDSGTSICWSSSVFGVDCPFCGGLRCVNALVRGDWLAAADHNLILAVLLPVVAVGWAIWMVATIRGRTVRWPRVPTAAWVSFGVIVGAFTVVRNLDLGPVAAYLAATAG